MPASFNARSRIWPAGPTNGLPARSSLSPGCSPTSMIDADCGPSPNTVWVAFFHKGQARHALACSRKASRSWPEVRDVGILVSPAAGMAIQSVDASAGSIDLLGFADDKL